MIRAFRALRGTLVVLLALGACASPLLARDFDRAADELRPLRLIVADATGLLPGIRVQPLYGDSDLSVVTDATGAVDLPLSASSRGLALRLTDPSGASWVVEQPLPAVRSPEGMIVLNGTEASLRIPVTQDEIDEHDAQVEDLSARLEIDVVAETEDDPTDGTIRRLRAPARGGTPRDLGRRTIHRDADGQAFASNEAAFASAGDGSADTNAFDPSGRSLPGSGRSSSLTAALAWAGETEPNNSVATCNPIDSADFGTTLTGQEIGSFSDFDWYCITLACGDNVDITVTPLGTLRPEIRLYYDDGTAGGAWIDGASAPFPVGNPANLFVSDNAAGDYFIRVRRSSSSGSPPWPYEMVVNTSPGTCIVDPDEPVWGTDESRADCTSILVPTAPSTVDFSRAVNWAGRLTTGRDVDTYCVSLDCGERLIVTMTPNNPTLVPRMRFNAPVGLSSGGNPQYELEVGTAGAPLTVVIEPAVVGGIWDIELTSNSTTKGSYDVSFSRDTGIACIDQYESDDAPKDCKPIAPGDLQERVLFPASEIDFACFDVLECGTLVSVQTRIPPGAWNVPPTDVAQTTLAVFDPNGDPIRGNLSKGDISQSAVNFTAMVPGTYTARVYGTRNSPPALPSNIITGRYDLLVTFVDGKEPLLTPVTQTTIDATSTQLDAEALAEVTTAVVEPGPGAVDLVADGNNLQLVPLPFTFNFYGAPKTSIRIGDDGFAQFSSGFSSNGFNECLPNAFTPNDAIYAFWDGLETRVNFAPDPTMLSPISRKTWEVVGTAPNRQFIITWFRMGAGAGQQGNLAGEHSFSITLSEGSDCIDIRYGDMFGYIGSEGQRATVGIENADGTDAMQFSCFEQKLEPGLVITYCPDGSGGYTEAVSNDTTEIVDYPGVRSCEYDVAADTAPFIDISTTGTEVTNWVAEYAVPGPGPFDPPLGFATNPDENYALLSLPFPFPYHGVIETDVAVFINGFLSFDTIPHPNATFRSNRCDQPETAAMDGKIMAFWDDLAFDEIGFFPNLAFDGGVYTELVDPSPAAGDASFIVMWQRATIPQPCIFAPCPLATPDRVINFEIILHESGDIEFRYGDMGGTDPYTHSTGYTATVGLEDQTGLSGTTYWCNDSGSNFGDNRFQGPLVQDHRVTFTPVVDAGPTFEWYDDATNDLLGTGPTFVTDDTTPCELRLDVTVRDPEVCCPIVESEFFTLQLLPEVNAALAPAPPVSVASVNSACVAPSEGRFIVECSATDGCDPDVELDAQLIVTNHDVGPLGDCIERVETVDVTCGQEVEVRLLSAVCAARPPQDPRQAQSVHSGLLIVSGESVVLEATATDSDGMSVTATFDPAVDPSPACEFPLADGSCCPSLVAPAPPDCPTSSMTCGG